MTDSRSALLEAAWELVVESFGFEAPSAPSQQVEAKILEQLKAADIAARADMTTGAFYNRWPNREAFLSDFLDYAISVDRSPTYNAIAAAYDEVRDRPYIEQVRRLAEVNIEQISANPSFAIQTHLWSLIRRRPDIAERMGTMYKDFRDPMFPVYEKLLASMGRELRPPIDMGQLSNIIVAFSEGLTMQIVSDGEGSATVDTFFVALLAITPMVTRKIGDTRTLMDVALEELSP